METGTHARDVDKSNARPNAQNKAGNKHAAFVCGWPSQAIMKPHKAKVMPA